MKKLLLFVIPAFILFGIPSHSQTALNFDGAGNYVDSGSAFNLTSYTKEVWVKWNGLSTQNNFISGTLADNPHAFWAANGRARAGHGSPFGTVIDEFVLPVDEWTHLAISYDGNTGEMVLYKNGAEIDRGFDEPGFKLTHVLLGAFRVEPGNPGDLNVFDGQLDDVRIWNHVRTSAEISNNYEACLDGTEAGLVAFYDFEDGPGSSIAADLTGNGYDGTLIDFDIDNDWVEGVSDCGDDPVEPESIEITSFYPNPTWNRVYLNLNRDFERLQVRVYNRYGYFVRGKNVYGPTDHVFATLRGLRRGYYYVMVIDRDTWEYDYVRVYKRGYY
ncbi:MAG: LamG domain-containing protein [Bacteroidia bacterium]|nr:LamG domain-containing protein [Bacteroidia bacterium]